MITTINEFKKVNEHLFHPYVPRTTKPEADPYEIKWNSLSFDDKVAMFSDEFEEFFDASDTYLHDVANQMFDTDWKDLNDKQRARIKYIIDRSQA